MTLEECDPVYKATIIARGGALGMVMALPENDQLNMHKRQCEHRIAMTMAGKAGKLLNTGRKMSPTDLRAIFSRLRLWRGRW